MHAWSVTHTCDAVLTEHMDLSCRTPLVNRKTITAIPARISRLRMDTTTDRGLANRVPGKEETTCVCLLARLSDGRRIYSDVLALQARPSDTTSLLPLCARGEPMEPLRD